MKQREKDISHIKKQKRRKRKLIWDSIMPMLYVLLLVSPLLVLSIMSLCIKPQEPIEATYADCYWDVAVHKSLILETKEHGSFMLPREMRDIVLQDIESGTLKPGNRLRITWYPWILRNGVVTFSCGDAIYGNDQIWKARLKKDARNGFLLSFIFIFIGLIACLYVFHREGKEFADIRRLKQKYRTRLQNTQELAKKNQCHK